MSRTRDVDFSSGQLWSIPNFPTSWFRFPCQASSPNSSVRTSHWGLSTGLDRLRWAEWTAMCMSDIWPTHILTKWQKNFLQWSADMNRVYLELSPLQRCWKGRFSEWKPCNAVLEWYQPMMHLWMSAVSRVNILPSSIEYILTVLYLTQEPCTGPWQNEHTALRQKQSRQLQSLQATLAGSPILTHWIGGTLQSIVIWISKIY